MGIKIIILLIPVVALAYFVGYNQGVNVGERITLKYHPACIQK